METTAQQVKKSVTNEDVTKAYKSAEKSPEVETPTDDKSAMNGQSVMKPFIIGYDRRIAFFPRFLSAADENLIFKSIQRGYQMGDGAAFAAKRAALIIALKAAPQLIPNEIKNPKVADYSPNDENIEETVRELFPEYTELDDRLLTDTLDFIIAMAQPVKTLL